MLRELKGFNAEKHDLDELVALKAFGDQMSNTYTVLGLEQPEWLKDRVEDIGREVVNRSRDLLAKELKETNLRLEGLKTQAEKREELLAKQARLQARLGMATKAA